MKYTGSWLSTMLVAVTVLGVGCPSSNTCVSGATQVCVCTATQMGVQTCSAAGSWNACQCGTPDGDGGAPDAGMVDAFVDPTVDAFAPRDAGMERSTSMMVGPAGGELTLEGATLTVPAGALTTTTELRMIATTIPGPAGYTLYSPVFRFEPAGTTFAMPATIRMPYTGNRARAALFWSQADGHWERIGGVPDATHVVGQVSHFSDGFAADGVDYREAPGATCSVTRAWANSTMRPSALGIVFTASDCDGRPVTGLTAADVEIREDDLLLGLETPLTLEAVDNPEIVINLAFDMSASTAPLLPDVIAGAQAFIDRLRMVRARPQVSVWVFDGSAGSAWQPFTRDLDLVRTRIGQLGMYVPADPASTNLFQGTLTSLQLLRARASEMRDSSSNGLGTQSFSVMFTDGADTTRAVTEASVITAIEAGPDMVFGVGLRSRDYDGAALRRIAPDGVIDAPDRATLPREMARVAAMIDDVVQSTYTARYCTPKRADVHPVRIGLVSSSEDRTVAPVVNLNADHFAAGCTAASLASSCERTVCGGLFCGGCGDSGVCTSERRRGFGLLPVGQCVVEDTCSRTGQTDCGGTCRSLDYEAANCGACGHACGSGQSCFAGRCVERRQISLPGPTVGTTSGERGELTGNLYIYSSPDGASGDLWRAPPRPGATPTRIASGLVGFVEESPTHAYFDEGTGRFRVAHTSVVREPVPRVAEDCGFHEWVSANEYRCLRFDGVHRLNLLTGADTLEFPDTRWSSIGSAIALGRNGVVLLRDGGSAPVLEGYVYDVYFYSYGGEVRYLFAAPMVDRDASGRAVGSYTDLFRDVHLLIAEPSMGGTFAGFGMRSFRIYGGNDRGWYAQPFISFQNGDTGATTDPECYRSGSRGCIYGTAAPNLSFDVHVCEHGETCPGSDVCCPNPTGNDFCAPSCS